MSASVASRRSWTAAFVAGVLLLPVAGERVYEAHHRSMLQRYDAAYGHRCMVGTAWGTIDWTAPLGSRAAGAAQSLPTASTPPRLTVYGTDSAGRSVAALTFTARKAIGDDQLRPADDATAQVLAQHQCDRA